MRKKLISKTYLRDVNKYELKIYLNMVDCYIAVKKIVEISKPFILESGEKLIDNGYYIVEILPKNEHYTIRIFLNDKKERISYYCDITKENGLDEDTLIPYYEDLYLDVVFDNKHIEILDENELNEALIKGIISKEDFDLANQTKENLVKSIENETNLYFKMNLDKYLKF